MAKPRSWIPILIFSTIQLVSNGSAAESRGAPPVRLNEILVIPGDGQSEAVEILNTDSKARDICGWIVTDGDGNDVVLPDKLPPIPSKGIVLVVFDGKGGEQADALRDDLDFAGDNLVVIHSLRDRAGDVFDDLADDCALYAKGERSALTIVDFVAFGSLASSDAAHAVKAGIWRADDLIITNSQGLKHEGRIVCLAKGGTLARSNRAGTTQAWDICGPDEASLGRPNGTPAPQCLGPSEGDETLLDSRLGSTIGFAWSRLGDAIGYDFQLASDAEFKNLIASRDGIRAADTSVEEMARFCTTRKTIFYWRVRGVTKDGKGPWSQPRTFSLVKGGE